MRNCASATRSMLESSVSSHKHAQPSMTLRASRQEREMIDGMLRYNNEVERVLSSSSSSSSIFTRNSGAIFEWLGPRKSDFGIVNVDITTYDAKSGGESGANEHTGDGCEAGSDFWKQQMRQSMCTTNHSDRFSLVQGINLSSSTRS